MVQEILVQDLPDNLARAWHTARLPGEELRLSLRGAIGEALVVTDKRIAVVREGEVGDEVKVHILQLATVSGARMGTTPTGGKIEIVSSAAVKEDQRTVYFPIQDIGRFEAAAARIEVMVRGGARSGEAATQARPIESCPSCSAPVSQRDAFCAACGQKLRDMCQMCAGLLPAGASFCPSCGSAAALAVLECPACGSRVNSTVMTHCGRCGTSIVPRCSACGASIVAGLEHCRYCGREIGAYAAMPGRSQRLRRDEVSSQMRTDEPTDEAQEVAESPAARHTEAGARLFDEDRLTEAIEEFRRAVMLEPDNSSYHCNLAVAYDEAEMDDDACREYERTLELNPDDTTALLYLGYLLNESEDPERAGELWRRLIEIAPGTPEAEEAHQNLRAQEAL